MSFLALAGGRYGTPDPRDPWGDALEIILGLIAVVVIVAGIAGIVGMFL